MMIDPKSPSSRATLIALAALLVAIGGVAGSFWRARDDRAATEAIVRDYILEHPEILPQAMENLGRREGAKQLAVIRPQLEQPYPGAVLGNPDGKVTLVEFTDFACGFCRQSVADVEALIAEHPDLRIVVRELPILSPQSADAARMALAAAEQGRYAAFHTAMFAAGLPDPATIEAAAKTAGLDMARARATIADPRTEAELKRNVQLAQQLGFSGTPAWVVGDDIISGAVGKARLDRAIVASRK